MSAKLDETLPCGVLPEDPLPATEERVRQKGEMDAAIRAAVDEAVAEERKALREIVRDVRRRGPTEPFDVQILAALDARSKS